MPLVRGCCSHRARTLPALLALLFVTHLAEAAPSAGAGEQGSTGKGPWQRLWCCSTSLLPVP